MTSSAAPSEAPGVVPVTILTGFLGAGKTTLLNRILTGDHGLRVGVLVNDFGPINIDAELVVGVKDDMISLANGCVCCQIRDDLVEAVDRLVGRPTPPEYIVLEASGVADPLGIWTTFNDSRHREAIRLDSVTCVLDADQAFAHLEDVPEVAMLKLRQIGCADLVILNKADLAGADRVELVRSWVEYNFRRLRVIESTFCDVPYEVLLGVGRFDPARLERHREDEPHPAGQEDHNHGDSFATWSYETEQPMSVTALKEMIRRQLPGSVYRCKGIVYTDDEPGMRLVLQTVGRRAEIEVLDPWAGRTPRTRIVAIGLAGGLNPAGLESLFDACLADVSGGLGDHPSRAASGPDAGVASLEL